MPSADIGQQLIYYVAKGEDDEHDIHITIRDELTLSGRKATAGARDMAPGDAQVLVTYDANWEWDVASYLSALDIAFRDPVTEEEFAGGRSMKGSLLRSGAAYHTKRILQKLIALVHGSADRESCP